MIIRSHQDRFIMIQQHDHAAISGKAAEMWDNTLFSGQDRRSSVEYAIRNHDIGWKFMDEAPFWNDQTDAPYTFTDYPTEPKTVLYRYGIEEVARTDQYAALLCNRHYMRFLHQNTSDAAQKFIREQHAWHEKIVHSIGDFNPSDYAFHYGILQLLDDLSLFLCLNERGVSIENEHPFFRHGITIRDELTAITADKMRIYWKDSQTVHLDPFPFRKDFTVTLKQRTVTKEAIEQNGLLDSYQDASVENIDIALTQA